MEMSNLEVRREDNFIEFAETDEIPLAWSPKVGVVFLITLDTVHLAICEVAE